VPRGGLFVAMMAQLEEARPLWCSNRGPEVGPFRVAEEKATATFVRPEEEGDGELGARPPAGPPLDSSRLAAPAPRPLGVKVQISVGGASRLDEDLLSKLPPRLEQEQVTRSSLEAQVAALLEEQQELQDGHRATWQAGSEAVDRKEREIHQAQVRLLSEQLVGFSRHLTALRGGFDDLAARCERDRMQAQAFQEEVHRDKEDLRTELLAALAARAVQQSFEAAGRRETQDLGDRLGDLQREVASLHEHSGALHGGHRELQERVQLTEQSVATQLDRHAKKLLALKTGQARQAAWIEASRGGLEGPMTDLLERMKAIEHQVGQASDRQAKKLYALSSGQERHWSVAATQAETLDALAERLSCLEKKAGQELADPAVEKQQAPGTLCEAAAGWPARSPLLVEAELGTAAQLDRHSKKLFALKTAIERQAATIKASCSGLEGPVTDLLERMRANEHQVGQAADRHAKKFYALGTGQERHRSLAAVQEMEHAERHIALAERLACLEQKGGEQPTDRRSQREATTPQGEECGDQREAQVEEDPPPPREPREQQRGGGSLAARSPRGDEEEALERRVATLVELRLAEARGEEERAEVELKKHLDIEKELRAANKALERALEDAKTEAKGPQGVTRSVDEETLREAVAEATREHRLQADEQAKEIVRLQKLLIQAEARLQEVLPEVEVQQTCA